MHIRAVSRFDLSFASNTSAKLGTLVKTQRRWVYLADANPRHYADGIFHRVCSAMSPAKIVAAAHAVRAHDLGLLEALQRQMHKGHANYSVML